MPMYGIGLKAPSTKQICTLQGETFSTSYPSFSFPNSGPTFRVCLYCVTF
jgi:hypothetical protein